MLKNIGKIFVIIKTLVMCAYKTFMKNSLDATDHEVFGNFCHAQCPRLTLALMPTLAKL